MLVVSRGLYCLNRNATRFCGAGQEIAYSLLTTEPEGDAGIHRSASMLYHSYRRLLSFLGFLS